MDLDITGTYRIYQNNELISEAKNALTETGKDILVRYLLKGRKVNFVNSLCVGISNTANVVSSSTNLITDNSLGFQVATLNAEGASFDFTDDSAETIVYSGTLYGDQQFAIYELGISSQIVTLGAADPELLFDFDLIDTFDKNGTAATAGLIRSSNARIGTQMLSIPVTPNPTTDYIEETFDNTIAGFDLVQTYSSRDIFTLAAFKPSSSVASVTIRFSVDDSNYYTLNVPLTSASGYKVARATKGSAVRTGSPQWSDIVSMRINHNSGSAILLDAIRIEKAPGIIDRDNGLISRAVLTSPVLKVSGTPLDIEYSLVIGFNKGV